MRIAAAFEQVTRPPVEPKTFLQDRKALLIDLIQLCSEMSKPPLCSFCNGPYTGSRSEHNLTHFMPEFKKTLTGRLVESVRFAFGISGNWRRAGSVSFPE